MTTIRDNSLFVLQDNGNNYNYTGAELKADIATVAAGVPGPGGDDLWLEVGGNNLRPKLPNSGISLTGSAIVNGNLTVNTNATVSGQLNSGTLITSGGIDCKANLTVRGNSTHVGNLSCQSKINASGDIVSSQSLGCAGNVTAGSTFFGQSLNITRNGTASSPVITIGASENGSKMIMWSSNDEVNIGLSKGSLDKNAAIKFNSKEFFIQYGVKDDSSGNTVKMKSDGRLVQSGSSRSLKQNIQDLNVSGLLDVLDNARMVSFEYKASPGVNTVGMIAEELYDIDTRFVYAEEGVPLGINYEMLTLPLIAGYRQQKAEITTLKETVANLVTRIEQLEADHASMTNNTPPSTY